VLPAEDGHMAAGVIGRLPRLALIAMAIGLFTAALGLAANSTLSTPSAPVATPGAAEPQPLVVPDVRKQAYVFAKGTLEQNGFAWRVEGSVPGFAANTVVSQSPAPGSRLIADGAPIIVLRLARNGSYAQEGVPENASPFAGKAARLVGSPAPAKPAPKPAAEPAAAPKPAAKPKPAAQPKPAAAPKPNAAARKPAFAVAGAPAEPADEIALNVRAKRLAAWLEQHPTPSDANVNHWLYQHNWIVTGAQFGWSSGAEALRTLVAVDKRVQELWGIGASSERLAASALAEVGRRSK
jgi:PASTA domain-containing protein